MPAPSRSQRPKLLDEVRQLLRVYHYSIHTERSYVDWIVRFAQCHQMHSREDPFCPAPKIEAFLTYLAVDKNVAPAAENQETNHSAFRERR